MPFRTQSAAQKKVLKGIFQSLKDAVARCVKETILYDSNSILSNWNSAGTVREPAASVDSESEGKLKGGCEIIIQNMTTLAGARLLDSFGPSKEDSGAFELERKENKIGILNFADAKKPGGLVVEGAATQEESIARSSTLYRPSPRRPQSRTIPSTKRARKEDSTRIP